MQSLAMIDPYRDVLAGILGLFVGSFLNYWAHRALTHQSVFSNPLASRSCEHQLKLSIPLLPYLMRKAGCKHCHSSTPWHYPLVEILTAGFFIVILRYFGWTINGLAMLYFVCVLITVSITDFKEKIIPHEITYPSILLGIIFSTTIRHDFMATLAGIGISYIFFDFVAFYGLKVYLFYNKPQLVLQCQSKIAAGELAKTQQNIAKSALKTLSRSISLSPPVDLIKRKSKSFTRKNYVLPGGQPVEEFEVMGGGDAVLAALISAWLGLPKLLLALLISFMAGTVLGAGYLLFEMHKQKLLGSALRPLAFSAALGAVSFVGIAMILARLLQQSLSSMHWLVLSLIGATVGGIIGIIQTGSGISKPFPFGRPWRLVR